MRVLARYPHRVKNRKPTINVKQSERHSVVLFVRCPEETAARGRAMIAATGITHAEIYEMGLDVLRKKLEAEALARESEKD